MSATRWIRTVGFTAAALLTTAAVPASEPLPSEIAAVQAELERGVAEFALPEAERAYRAEARWVRAELLSLDGSYGGIITDVAEKQATGLVSVRVGSYERDNTNYWGGDNSIEAVDFALSASPHLARHKVWLSLDQSYRSATRAYAGKRAMLERLREQASIPDYTPPPSPQVRLVAPSWSEEIDREGLRHLVATLSERFKAWPEIDNGDVHIQILRSHETMVNTEGLVGQWAHDRSILAVTADTQASDGMPLDHSGVIHFQTTPEVDDALIQQATALVDQVLRELTEMATAPMIDEEYDGPILFVDDAPSQFLASTVVTQASGMPAGWDDDGEVAELEPAWQRRLGKVVMPPFLDLVDDPHSPGFGSYELDSEGVVPDRLTIVDDGELVGLLMTRTPNRYASGSRGRMRMSPSLSSGPTVSNLALTSRRRGLSRAALERELLTRARNDGYEFAYIIERFRDGVVLGPVPRDSAAAIAGTAKMDLPLPARIVRIEAGGRRTVVRGAILAPASMRVLRRIRATGTVVHRVPMRIPVGSFGGFGAAVGIDGTLSHTVDVEIRSPDLLIEGLELLVERGEYKKPPVLVHPVRRGPKPAHSDEN